MSSNVFATTDLNLSSHRHKSVFDTRIAIIDFLRGFCLILVFFDHIMYDLRDYLPGILYAIDYGSGFWTDFLDSYIYKYYFNAWYYVIVREMALMIFVFLSGISCAFSKSNAKRAIKMLLFSTALALITNLINAYLHTPLLTGEPIFSDSHVLLINFNIIAVISCCVLLYSVFEKFNAKGIFWVTFSLLMFSMFILPAFYQQIGDQAFLYWPFWAPDKIVINDHPYLHSDYMSLFPYIIGFFIGALVAKTWYKNPSLHLNHNYRWMRPICFIGRNSLWFYLGHQIVFVAIFILISICLGVYS